MKSPRAPNPARSRKGPDFDALFNVTLSAFGIGITLSPNSRMKVPILAFLGAIASISLLRSFIGGVESYFRSSPWLGKMLSLLPIAVLGVLLLIEGLDPQTPYDAVESVQYEPRVYGMGGSSQSDDLISSDSFFRRLYKNAEFYLDYLDAPELKLELRLSLSLSLRAEALGSALDELVKSLEDSTEYTYIFKFGDEYRAIDARNEGQRLSISPRPFRYNLLLSFDFREFLRGQPSLAGGIPLVNYKESLLVFSLKDRRYYKGMKGAGLREAIEKARPRNQEELLKAIRAPRLHLLYAGSGDRPLGGM